MNTFLIVVIIYAIAQAIFFNWLWSTWKTKNISKPLSFLSFPWNVRNNSPKLFWFFTIVNVILIMTALVNIIFYNSALFTS